MTDRSASFEPGPNFLRAIIEADLEAGKYDKRVVTRFPPEPNGYLHIGHAKSICLNFGLAADYKGICHLRFDDTNPETEDPEYVESIQNDVRWLGFEWDDKLFFASDYFEQLYECAIDLIKSGKAYVDSQSDEEIRDTRGTVTRPGRESPYRDRPIADNLDLFRRMRAGEFADGTHVLRARIDMSAPNMKMRDPLLYRIRHAHHYRTGDEWCIYPMYDFAHPLSDAIENITHSFCTLEFENNRELYDWVVDNAWTTPRPYQYEFNRLNLDYTVMSKRKLLQLVEEGYVSGWDDPRLPTLAGLRRRGVTPDSIRDFCARVGVARTDSRVDIALLEYSIRNDLNQKAPRVMAVLDPLRVVITNYPNDEVDWLNASYWPHDVPREGSRKIPFTKHIYIERADFMEDPPRKFFRLAPGREVRLRYGYFITCEDVVKDPRTGEIIELHCRYDPETRGGDAPDGRKVKATLHWVSADRSLPAEVRLYDRLFSDRNPEQESDDWKSALNPESAVTVEARIEPSITNDDPATRYQFERQGYFWRDPVDSRDDHIVFNRIVTLRDTWAKVAAREERVATTVTGKNKAPSPESADVTATSAERRSEPTRTQLSKAAEISRRHGIDEEDAVLIAGDEKLAHFFEQALASHGNATSIANWLIHELPRAMKGKRVDQLPFGPAELAELVSLVDDGTISGRTAKELLARLAAEGGRPGEMVREQGLSQVTDPSELRPVVASVIDRYPDKAVEFRGGKHGLMGFFVGQVMRETGGKANPELTRDLLLERLKDVAD